MKNLIVFLVIFLIYNLSFSYPVYIKNKYQTFFYSKGRERFYFGKDMLDLPYETIPMNLFDINIYNIKAENDGIHFYLPSYSKVLDNSFLSAIFDKSYESYYFFLRKKHISPLLNFYSHYHVEENFWEGRTFYNEFSYKNHFFDLYIADSFFSDNRKVLYNFERYKYKNGKKYFSIKREFYKDKNDKESSLKKFSFGFTNFDTSFSYLNRDSYKIDLKIKHTINKFSFSFNPFVYKKLYDFNMKLSYGNIYFEKVADYDWLSNAQNNFSEIGITYKENGLYLRYVEKDLKKYFSLKKKFIKGLKFSDSLPLFKENLYLNLSGDILFNENYFSYAKGNLFFQKYLFKDDLRLIFSFTQTYTFIQNETSKYSDFYLEFLLIHTRFYFKLHNLFNDDIKQYDEFFENESLLSFGINWFFYN